MATPGPGPTMPPTAPGAPSSWPPPAFRLDTSDDDGRLHPGDRLWRPLLWSAG